MSHCKTIQFLQHVRSYIYRNYGGTEAAFIISQRLRVLNPQPYQCGLCDQKHQSHPAK